MRIKRLEGVKRVAGILKIAAALKITDDNVRVIGDSAGEPQAVIIVSVIGWVFERIARRHQPPDRVETEPFQRLQRYFAMTLMRRVKRSAQKSDAAAL
jgi:hypothetical protein